MKILLRIAKWGSLLLVAGVTLVVYIWLQTGAFGQAVATETRDCGVIFGAAVWRDDVPSHALEDRVMSGLELYEKELVDCLILSGGPSTFGAHEVDVMAKILLEQGVSDAALQRDYEGLNTLMTIQHLPENTTFTAVSQDFHLFRIRMLMHRHGHKNAQIHASTYHNGRFLKEPYYRFREVMGVLYYGLTVWPSVSSDPLFGPVNLSQRDLPTWLPFG